MSRRRMVEGPTGADHEDKGQRPLEMIEHIAGRNPQCLETRVGKRGIAPGITLRVLAHRMRFAINLDRETAFEAGKVDNVAATGELAAEAEAVGAFPEVMPKHHFWKGHLPTQLTRTADVGVRRAEGAVPDSPVGPSTMLRMVPLPVPGRI